MAPHADPAAARPEPALPIVAQDDPKVEYARRRKAAGDDVEALWELYLWCDAYGLAKESRSCLRAIIKEQPSHKEAREGLGHVYYDGQWFKTEKALEKFKREEAKRLAKEQGLVEYEGEWVPSEDIPFLERGMVRDDDGNWIKAEDLERMQQGWRRQDLVWVSPAEVSKIEEGLWKCGDDWKSLEDANSYHAYVERWWVVPSSHFMVHSTCDRALIEEALETMNLAFRDLVRLFGVAPDGALPVVLLRDPRQYGRFAAGEDSRNGATESNGLSSVHHAFFADVWRAPETENVIGAGVGMWDTASDETSAFGPFAARHAAGLSFVEGIDPSPKTLAKVAKSESYGESDVDAFWAEKRIPEWLRYGAAAYAERYYIDSLVKQGGNPNWVREWSISNLIRRGGMRPLRQVIDLELSVDDIPESEKLISERGLLVAFILDGGCAPVVEAHEAFRDALLEGNDPSKSLEKLESELVAHEAELRAFAGI